MRRTPGGAWLLVPLLILLGSNVWAFNTDVHELLNGRAADVSSLDSYLKQNLGLTRGVVEPVNGEIVRRWIQIGGSAEDQFFGIELLGALFRSINHFHNPLRTWDKAGLDAVTLLCPPLVFKGEASVRWAQEPNQGISGKAAWGDARQAFYQGLTLSSKSERDAKMAKMFQILGQQMHLIADLAVPAHTRNDPHCPSPEGFEEWASRNGSLVQSLTAGQPVPPDPAIFTLGVPIQDDIAKVPIARLWDSDQYDGTNPDITLSPTIGLAEYTNANFFSDDTVFSAELPFPGSTSVALGSPEPEPKTGELRRYFIKVRDGETEGNTGYRLAVPSALYEFLPAALKDKKKGLDDNVFENYAELLLPRAVGYSAALLDYFFRGKIEATSDVRLNAQGEWRVYVKIVNRTAGEAVAGDVEFYDETVDGARVFVASSPLTLLPDGDTELDLDIRSSGDGSPLPSRYLLVFRGMLGAEESAVATTWVAWRDGAWRIALGADLPGFDGINRVGASIENQPNFSLLDAAFGASLVIDAFEFKVREEGYPAMLHELTFMMLYREMTFLPGNTLNFRVLVGGCGNESLGFSDRRQSTGPAMVQLVEFEPPPTWAEFFAYQWPGPSVKRVLAEFTSSDPPGSIDVTGVPLIGLRLIYGLVPDAPPLNLDRSSNSFAYLTESWCQVLVSLTFQ